MNSKKSKKLLQNRVFAIDVARGLAIIGMYIQHFAINETNIFVSGNTMILFMLVSGISYTLMYKNYNSLDYSIQQIKEKIFFRSFFIGCIGYGILLLNPPFGVVLQAYAVIYLISIPLLKMPTKKLLVLSGINFLLCPVIMVIGLSLFQGNSLFSDLAGGPLSAAAWLPVFSTGIIIGRLKFNKVKGILLASLGTIVLIPSKLFSITILPVLYEAVNSNLSVSNTKIDEFAAWPKNTQPINWQMLFIDAPNGGSTFELLIGVGAALIIVGILIVIDSIFDSFDIFMAPLINVGKISLTLYVLQFIIAWIISLLGYDVTQIEIGTFFLGDFILTIALIVLAQVMTAVKFSPLEKEIRRFENYFIEK